MKFESKFGLGEIVIYQMNRGDTFLSDELLEVFAVSFDKKAIIYTCRRIDGSLVFFEEEELIGDENFNQETGSYPEGDER
jgi:hypothetical protein